MVYLLDHLPGRSFEGLAGADGAAADWWMKEVRQFADKLNILAIKFSGAPDFLPSMFVPYLRERSSRPVDPQARPFADIAMIRQWLPMRWVTPESDNSGPVKGNIEGLWPVFRSRDDLVTVTRLLQPDAERRLGVAPSFTDALRAVDLARM